MRGKFAFLFLALAAGAGFWAFAALPYIDVEVVDAVAAPGGSAQIIVQLTEPKPIITGDLYFRGMPAWLSEIGGVGLYDEAGNVSGIAQFAGGQLRLSFASQNATFGTGTPYEPLMVITLGVRPDAPVGALAPVAVDVGPSVWNGPDGQPYPEQYRHGTVRVAGTVSIHEVTPGGGRIFRDQELLVRGIGFLRRATVSAPPLDLDETVKFYGSDALGAISESEGTLDFRRVTVQNPDGASACYYTYLKGTPVAVSAEPSVLAVKPLYGTRAFTEARYPLAHGGAALAAVGVLNPRSRTSARVVIEAFTAAEQLITSQTFTLPGHGESFLSLSEYLPTLGVFEGGSVRVRSLQGVRIVAAQRDASGWLAPVAPISSGLPDPGSSE